MLMTFQRLGAKDTNDYLIRLGHQYGEDEDKKLSQPVSVDLANLFDGFTVVSVEEMTLTANQKLSDWQRKRLSWTGSRGLYTSSLGNSNTTIILQPMDIRTFNVTMIISA